MVRSRYQFGIGLITILVALRLIVGWHFYKEGVDKITHPGFSSAGFLANAKGPLAPMFLRLAISNPDPDGIARLDQKETLRQWKLFRERIGLHYQFEQRQNDLANRALARRERQLKDFFARNREDIETYRKGLERRRENRSDVLHTEVASLHEQRETIENALRRDLAPWLATIDRMWDDYEVELQDLVTSNQRSRSAPTLNRPGEPAPMVGFINSLIPYFDMIIGALLLLGLLTRPAALLAAAFMASVVASQWPGSEGAVATYFQADLTLALLVLVATGAGRFAGLDYFLSRFALRPLMNCCCRRDKRQETSTDDTLVAEAISPS